MTTAPPTVLIIEDDAEIADTYATFLEEEEYTVRTAYSGKSGLAQFDEDVDLVLLDRRMPSYSGDAVLDAIRDREQDCPVAMLTAIDPDIDIVDLPFDAYVVKPVDREELLDTVKRLLSQAKSEHNNEVLDVLGDQKARHILSYLVDTAATAKELGTATEYSLPTVYRRLNALKQANLIEERTQLDPEGNHVKVFTAAAEQVHVDIDDGFRVDVQSSTDERSNPRPK